MFIASPLKKLIIAYQVFIRFYSFFCIDFSRALCRRKIPQLLAQTQNARRLRERRALLGLAE
jgi:hypothetical protein